MIPASRACSYVPVDVTVVVPALVTTGALVLDTLYRPSICMVAPALMVIVEVVESNSVPPELTVISVPVPFDTVNALFVISSDPPDWMVN